METAADIRARLIAAVEHDASSSDFDLNQEMRPAGLKTRAAAVLVAIQQFDEEARVLLTKRASALRNHPGQIAFPGGKVEPGDVSAVDAALREAHEEIGLPRDIVEIICETRPHETVTGFSVTPVLGWIAADFNPVPDPAEVEETFSVPLSHLVDPAKYMIESRFFRGVRRQYFVVPYGPYYIWGATARILRRLAVGVSQ